MIDNFAEAPEEIIEDAAMLRFDTIDAHYPGVRAAFPARQIAAAAACLREIVLNTFGLDTARLGASGSYSLVTTRPEDLRPIQRLPHFDGVGADRLAVLLFLGQGDNGGTAFYRHRTTGFESVTAARLERFNEALRADVERHGLPPAGYISGSTTLYERIGRHEGRFNRALVYRGHTLHCADLPGAVRLSSDPRAGRLTVNLFLGPDGAR